ncbi:hypothetical protein ACS0TY_009172 [Phlomoides rotata]
MAVETTDSEEMKIDDDLCFLKYKRNYSQLSTSSTMSQNSRPTFEYQRRCGKQRKNFFDVLTLQTCGDIKTSDACPSPICSETPPQEHVISVSECATESARSPIMHPVELNEVATAPLNHAAEEAGSEEALTIDVNRTLNACNASDDCSSSKLYLKLCTAALNTDVDDANECSSSGALVSEKAPQEISQRDIALLILRSQGLFDEVSTRQDGASAESNGVSRDTYCSTSCKVCERMGSTLNMLICDNCEDAFHISCYNPRVTILPVNEWLCSSCLKKKHKILKDKSTSNVVSIRTETGGNQYSASELDLGSLEFMFRDTEPYMSDVQIGDEFQADVPVWCGPGDEESDLTGETLEFDPYDNNNMQELDSMKLKLSSIGNWLQCREVIGEGVDGTICGKWRRAPLFEVQTDNWECFRCVLWDPVHADCAVPQELDTKEVMKQLKYIEMLRPRLAAKGRKLDCAKSNGSQDVSGKDKQGDTMKKSAKHVRSSLA